MESCTWLMGVSSSHGCISIADPSIFLHGNENHECCISHATRVCTLGIDQSASSHPPDRPPHNDILPPWHKQPALTRSSILSQTKGTHKPIQSHPQTAPTQPSRHIFLLKKSSALLINSFILDTRIYHHQHPLI